MYNSIIINLGRQCNAACRHCCFACSPQKKEGLSHQELTQLVMRSIQSPTIDTFAFTGGEVFLDYPFLIELLTITSQHNKKATLISNGFWGSNPKRVRRYFEELAPLKVTNITLSHDEFHGEYIPTSSIKTILEIAREFPSIKVMVNAVVSKSYMSDDLVEELGESALGVPITKFPLVPVGEAENLPKEEFQPIYSLGHPNQLYCPGFDLVYHYDGNIYPCCSPTVFDTQLIIDQIDNQRSFEEVVDKMNANLLLFIMRKEGFRWFIDIVEGHDEFADVVLPHEFSSICMICRLLFQSQRTIEKLTPYMRAYYEEML